MKKILFPIALVLIFLGGCRSTKQVAGKAAEPAPAEPAAVEAAPQEVDFSKQETFLIGYFNLSRLMDEPYNKWYFKGYDEYSFNSDAVNKLLEISKDSLSIKVVMGTWCPDSRKQVPRFMRIVDTWQFPHSRMTFIGVDDNKISPVGEYFKLGIERVPTFIFYKNNIETGRIIENPVTSLEQDMVNILTGVNKNK
jgi:hypothetical protein